MGTAKQFDLEGCLALEPDLVILPLKLQDSADTLAEMGIPALVVNPEDQDLLNEMTSLIGQATNTADRGRRPAGLCRTAGGRPWPKSWTALKRPASIWRATRTFCPPQGDAMYQSDMIRMAGGVNAAGRDHRHLLGPMSAMNRSWHGDPAYIILASDAAYTVEDVLNDPALAGCAAVENGNVYQVPGDAEAWGQPGAQRYPGVGVAGVGAASGPVPRERGRAGVQRFL